MRKFRRQRPLVEVTVGIVTAILAAVVFWHYKDNYLVARVASGAVVAVGLVVLLAVSCSRKEE
jgi:membrane protein YdbS with pleckstrin-like domain